jgi:hypothetical protein
MPHGERALWVWTSILELFLHYPFILIATNVSIPTVLATTNHTRETGVYTQHFRLSTQTQEQQRGKMLVPYEVCSTSYLIGFPSINVQQAVLQMTNPRLLFIPVFYIHII